MTDLLNALLLVIVLAGIGVMFFALVQPVNLADHEDDDMLKPWRDECKSGDAAHCAVSGIPQGGV